MKRRKTTTDIIREIEGLEDKMLGEPSYTYPNENILEEEIPLGYAWFGIVGITIVMGTLLLCILDYAEIINWF